MTQFLAILWAIWFIGSLAVNICTGWGCKTYDDILGAWLLRIISTLSFGAAAVCNPWS